MNINKENGYCEQSLRHKERKSYADIIDIDDEEIYGKRNYSLHEKLTSTDVYTTRHVKEMRAAGSSSHVTTRT